MKIVIDARIIYTSTGRYVERLLHHLQAIDHKNEYVVLLLAKDMERWQPQADNFRKVEANFPIYSMSEQTGLRRLLDGLAPDLVHFTMPQQPMLYRGACVTTVHDLTLLDFVNRRQEGAARDLLRNVIKPRVFRWVLAKAVRRSRAVLTPTNYVRDQLIDRYGLSPNRVVTTPEAADELAATPKRPAFVQSGEKFVMYVGNAYPYKNVGLLILAHQMLGRDDMKLVLVGKTDYFYDLLAREAKQKGYKNVVFTGFIPDEELAWLYQHAQLYVFPSLSEGFGLPPLEAMTYGLPVLASDASCIPEVLGGAAAYFNPRKPEELARKLRELLDNAKLRERLSEAGRERLKHFSWRRMAEQTLEMYERAPRLGAARRTQ
jgi:glycosyltransferase involved in cell wall biosynthesis